VFFMVFMLAINGGPASRPAEALSYDTFPTRAACYAEAAARARIIAATGAHGMYLCMYDREPDAALARERAVRF